GAGGGGGRRRGPRSPGGVRRGEELSLSERRPRSPPGGRPGDERKAPGGAPGRRSLDRGPADRGGDPEGVRAGPRGRRVMSWARRYSALIRSAWLVDLQYRASIVLWLLWGVTEPAIALGIWWRIAGAGPVGGCVVACLAA